MKRLLLLRHAKSDWDAAARSDHGRPLNERGVRDAAIVGTFVARYAHVPDRVVSSSARRAHDTVRFAAEAGGWGCPIETTDALYDVSVERVLEVIRGLDDRDETVLLAGHEPATPETAGVLLGAARLRWPTATLARLDTDATHWADAAPGTFELAWLVRPKLLAAAGAGEGEAEGDAE